MTALIPHGLHHVTAIATDPRRSSAFYPAVLGLRLVKQTVNFDAPDSFHLYFGDAAGRPSTLLTFFPWPGAPRGRGGSGQASATAFSVPPESLGWWQHRLAGMGVACSRPITRGHEPEEVLQLRDPDGLLVELVAAPGDARSGWDGEGSVPADHAVRGLHAVTLAERVPEETVALLCGLLGMRHAGEHAGRVRVGMAGGAPGAVLDVVIDRRARGQVSVGAVHHVALRVPDQAAQTRWRDELVAAGLSVSEIRDRRYFTSIYFHEPGGALLEIATDGPGFTVDEPLLQLGRRLMLPPWLEPDREQIAAALPPMPQLRIERAAAS